eukprot:c16285_g1_i1.p1 GENE.c16285_g1_i1~~c16285_g1_i1.p1  ORF type:complete len:287 (+),score=122.19 c16285_g1_i1:65-925(+)
MSWLIFTLFIILPSTVTTPISFLSLSESSYEYEKEFLSEFQEKDDEGSQQQPLSYSGSVQWKNAFGQLPDTNTAPDLTKGDRESAAEETFKVDAGIFEAAHATEAQVSAHAFGVGTDEVVTNDEGDASEVFPHMDLSKYKNANFWKGAIDPSQSDDPFFMHRDTPEENPNFSRNRSRTLEEVEADRMQMALCRVIEQAQIDNSQECAMCMNVVAAVLKQTWVCACYRNPLDMSNYDSCVDMKQELERDRPKIVEFVRAHHLDPRMAHPRICDQWRYCPGRGAGKII